MIDYSKPTAQMLGRWQPFHDGHLALFKEILKKTGQVVIMVRSMPQTDNNPFVFEDIKKRIEEKLKDYVGQFDVIKVPNITNICYGRDVGYKIENNDFIVEKMMAEDLMKMVQAMPDGYKVVFNMFAIEGYSHGEIADTLGISENTSKSQYSRARAYLRERLEKN
jgi:RNA polymerase sigma factor (sigma-70 family)